MQEKAHAQKAEAKKAALPDKLFYKIGEVSRITGIEPYVLRYWESEFQFLRPRKSKSGQRVYVKKDLETILKIKNLLYDERYTIEGVRKKFGEVPKAEPPQASISGQSQVYKSPSEVLEYVRKRLREILENLS